MNLLFTVAILFLVLGILVFIHELGHYWAAKRFGVWVHRFAIGIGSPIKGLSFRRGETEWAFAWLPIGGYVKMASREEEPASSVLEGGAENAMVPPDRVFEAKPVWQRMVIILAGVTFNLIFAWLIFVGLAVKEGRRYDPTTTISSVDAAMLPFESSMLADLPPGVRVTAINGTPVDSWGDITDRITHGSSDQILIEFDRVEPIAIALHRDALVERVQTATALRPGYPPVFGRIIPGTPAAGADLAVGDSVVAIDGEPIAEWNDAVRMIERAADRQITISLVRDGIRRDVDITPRAERRDPADSTSEMIGRIGAGVMAPYRTEKLSFAGAVSEGTRATMAATGLITRTLRGLVTGRVASREVGGPILIGQMAAESARAGITVLLGFMALISVNLAVVNLLPIPVLDGGAFLLLAVEGIIRRPLPAKLRDGIQIIGLVIVVGLMVLVFSNDIRRLLGWL